MRRFRLATLATLAGAMLAAGCASPCGGCGGVFHRMSMFRARRACPVECCSSCGGEVPIVGTASDVCEGPMLESPGEPMSVVPPLAGMAMPSPGMAMPSPFSPNLGAPLGPPSVPADPGRMMPVPNGAQPFPAEPSSRKRSR